MLYAYDSRTRYHYSVDTRVIRTALMAADPASSRVDSGKVNRLAGISFTSKLASQDVRNSCSRCGHLHLYSSVSKERGQRNAIRFGCILVQWFVDHRLVSSKRPKNQGFLQQPHALMPLAPQHWVGISHLSIYFNSEPKGPGGFFAAYTTTLVW